MSCPCDTNYCISESCSDVACANHTIEPNEELSHEFFRSFSDDQDFVNAQ